MAKIIIISDGKPGHLNQSYGLVDAIKRLSNSVEVEEHPVLSWFKLIGLILNRPKPLGDTSFLIAAGHRTHLTLLVLGWLLKSKTVVLMKPSLPCRWFSLCIVPEHDHASDDAENVLETVGALNRMQPGIKVLDKGLILVGGPSKHFEWNNESVTEQIKNLIAENAGIDWLLTTSRRTPEDFLHQLSSLTERLEIVPAQETPQGWLVEKLAEAEYCWVTEDSVSMVYESLTAGCKTGLISLPSSRESRIQRGLAKLKATGRVMTKDSVINSEVGPLGEADRCAEVLLKKGWL